MKGCCMNTKSLTKYLNDDVVCVVANDQTILTSNLKGIRPWLKWLRECPETLEEAMVVDKVVGKAAAMLMVVAKIKKLYTPIISDQALAYLKTQAIEFEYDQTVPFITNMANDGLCPMEETVLNTSDADEGYRLLLHKVQQLMQAKKQ
jgi:hypothetical protein